MEDDEAAKAMLRENHVKYWVKDGLLQNAFQDCTDVIRHNPEGVRQAFQKAYEKAIKEHTKFKRCQCNGKELWSMRKWNARKSEGYQHDQKWGNWSNKVELGHPFRKKNEVIDLVKNELSKLNDDRQPSEQGDSSAKGSSKRPAPDSPNLNDLHSQPVLLGCSNKREKKTSIPGAACGHSAAADDVETLFKTTIQGVEKVLREWSWSTALLFMFLEKRRDEENDSEKKVEMDEVINFILKRDTKSTTQDGKKTRRDRVLDAFQGNKLFEIRYGADEITERQPVYIVNDMVLFESSS